MRIFVAGGTGVIGSRVVQSLLAEGHDVWASTTDQRKAREVEKLGASTMVVDALVPGQLTDAVTRVRPEVIINQMTALSQPSSDYAAWLERTNRLRGEASVELVVAAEQAGTRRVVAQSASFMTAPLPTNPQSERDGAQAEQRDNLLGVRLDESAPLYEDAPEPLSGHVRANVALERAVMGSQSVEGVVLRYGFIYGPGTAYALGAEPIEQIRRGAFPVVGEGAGRYPFVHVEDAARAAVAAVGGLPTGVYNVVDDNPAAAREWIPFVARLLGAPNPPRVTREEAEASLGIQSVYYNDDLRAASNAKLTDTGFGLRYPSWRQGLATVLGGDSAAR
jgi:nucleoside-diphosphate-sugar epimerase